MLLKFKRKLGITTHFSKKINQQFLLKTIKYKARYGVLLQIEASVLPEGELFKQFAIIEKSVTPEKSRYKTSRISFPESSFIGRGRETLVESKNGHISLAVEKRFHFLPLFKFQTQIMISSGFLSIRV